MPAKFQQLIILQAYGYPSSRPRYSNMIVALPSCAQVSHFIVQANSMETDK